MTGVILVAGRGRRLGKRVPKCLLKIGQKTILERQLNALKRLRIEKLVCVVGYEKEKIQEEVRKLWKNQVKFIQNRRYERTNTIYSLYLAVPNVTDDVVYMNGDVVFRPDLIERLIEQKGEGALGIIRKRCVDEDVKVIVQDNKIVEIGKQLPPDKCYGEFTGIALFFKSMLGLLSKSLRDLIEIRGLVNEYFEAGLNEIKDKVVLKAVDVTNIPCIEIDFPEDLREAQKNHLKFDENGNR